MPKIIGMGPGKDGQDGLTREALPVRICSRHVADQAAVRSGGSFEKKRQMRGERLAFDLRHEEAEAVLLDEVVQPGEVCFREGGG